MNTGITLHMARYDEQENEYVFEVIGSVSLKHFALDKFRDVDRPVIEKNQIIELIVKGYNLHFSVCFEDTTFCLEHPKLKTALLFNGCVRECKKNDDGIEISVLCSGDIVFMDRTDFISQRRW